MRDIKFRAWDEQKKIMHNNFQWIQSGEAGNDWIVFMADGRNFADSVKDPYFSQQLKKMQLTPFNDIKNNNVYEDDYIEYRFRTKEPFSNDIIWSGRVFFDEGMWCVTREDGQIHSMNRINTIEIIGNYYEGREADKESIKNFPKPDPK